MLSLERIQALPRPTMPHKLGCYPTALAFGLTVLGRPHTPGEVANGIGTFPDTAASWDDYMRSQLWLLGKGVRLDIKNTQADFFVEPYFGASSTATYEEFLRAFKKAYGRREAAEMTSGQFETDRAFYREAQQQFGRYERQGRYKDETVRRFDGRFLRSALAASSGSVAIAHVIGGQDGRGAHTFAVIAHRDPNKAMVFNPGIAESELAVVNLGTVVDFMLPKRPLMFMS